MLKFADLSCTIPDEKVMLKVLLQDLTGKDLILDNVLPSKRLLFVEK